MPASAGGLPRTSLPIAVFGKTQLSHSHIGNLLTDRGKVAGALLFSFMIPRWQHEASNGCSPHFAKSIFRVPYCTLCECRRFARARARHKG
jgi:hypothetical protein